jgi:hypothetical protein
VVVGHGMGWDGLEFDCFVSRRRWEAASVPSPCQRIAHPREQGFHDTVREINTSMRQYRKDREPIDYLQGMYVCVLESLTYVDYDGFGVL